MRHAHYAWAESNSAVKHNHNVTPFLSCYWPNRPTNIIYKRALMGNLNRWYRVNILSHCFTYGCFFLTKNGKYNKLPLSCGSGIGHKHLLQGWNELLLLE
jgi:hypothetical protein